MNRSNSKQFKSVSIPRKHFHPTRLHPKNGEIQQPEPLEITSVQSKKSKPNKGDQHSQKTVPLPVVDPISISQNQVPLQEDVVPVQIPDLLLDKPQERKLNKQTDIKSSRSQSKKFQSVSIPRKVLVPKSSRGELEHIDHSDFPDSVSNIPQKRRTNPANKTGPKRTKSKKFQSVSISNDIDRNGVSQPADVSSPRKGRLRQQAAKKSQHQQIDENSSPNQESVVQKHRDPVLLNKVESLNT